MLNMELIDAAGALEDWKAQGDKLSAERDGLVRSAYQAGISVAGISGLSGLSRTTVYKILGIQEGGQQ